MPSQPYHSAKIFWKYRGMNEQSGRGRTRNVADLSGSAHRLETATLHQLIEQMHGRYRERELLSRAAKTSIKGLVVVWSAIKLSQNHGGNDDFTLEASGGS